MESPAVTDEHAGGEGPQVQRRVIEHALGFGISRQQELEAAVEAKTVERVGADAAADAVGRFENLKRNADLSKPTRTRETRKAGPDDDDGWLGHEHRGSGARVQSYGFRTRDH